MKLLCMCILGMWMSMGYSINSTVQILFVPTLPYLLQNNHSKVLCGFLEEHSSPAKEDIFAKNLQEFEAKFKKLIPFSEDFSLYGIDEQIKDILDAQLEKPGLDGKRRLVFFDLASQTFHIEWEKRPSLKLLRKYNPEKLQMIGTRDWLKIMESLDISEILDQARDRFAKVTESLLPYQEDYQLQQLSHFKPNYHRIRPDTFVSSSEAGIIESLGEVFFGFGIDPRNFQIATSPKGTTTIIRSNPSSYWVSDLDYQKGKPSPRSFFLANTFKTGTDTPHFVKKFASPKAEFMLTMTLDGKPFALNIIKSQVKKLTEIPLEPDVNANGRFLFFEGNEKIDHFVYISQTQAQFEASELSVVGLKGEKPLIMAIQLPMSEEEKKSSTHIQWDFLSWTNMSQTKIYFLSGKIAFEFNTKTFGIKRVHENMDSERLKNYTPVWNSANGQKVVFQYKASIPEKIRRGSDRLVDGTNWTYQTLLYEMSADDQVTILDTTDVKAPTIPFTFSVEDAIHQGILTTEDGAIKVHKGKGYLATRQINRPVDHIWHGFIKDSLYTSHLTNGLLLNFYRDEKSGQKIMMRFLKLPI